MKKDSLGKFQSAECFINKSPSRGWTQLVSAVGDDAIDAHDATLSAHCSYSTNRPAPPLLGTQPSLNTKLYHLKESNEP